MDVKTSIEWQVVVSAENTLYMGWQAKLFCFSALTRLGQRPIVVVHRTPHPLRPEFVALQERGFRVIEAPSFSAHPKGQYPPRNELGSLFTIASEMNSDFQHILFCEPDMLFVRTPEYQGSALAGEFYSYLDYRATHVYAAAKKLSVDHMVDELNRTSRIGVPYLLPTSHLKNIAVRWFEVLDAFERLSWVDIMYAFGIALIKEDARVTTTHLMQVNYDPLELVTGSLIHYCYGSALWDKRSFTMRSPFDIAEDSLVRGAGSGTLQAEIIRQLCEARQFYGG